MNLLIPASFMEPHHLTSPAPWAGHIPFASWLVAVQQPCSFVELGTYSGISYLAFCQAIEEQGLSTRTYAVDTWEGDAHAGMYGNEIYNSLRDAHDPHYLSFSTLMRMTFDEALPEFADSSIDLLHIDGLHTYEAVRHDFDTWLPKLSERGVVLFHDSAVRQGDFGVHRLWAEVAELYPSLEFKHSNGLGVLLVGPQQPEALLKLCQDSDAATQAQRFFSLVGARLERSAEILALQAQCRDAEEKAQMEQRAGAQRHQWIKQQDQNILALQHQQQQAQAALDKAQQEIVSLQTQCHDAEERFCTEQRVSDQRHQWIQQQDQTILALQRKQQQTQAALVHAQQELKQVYSSHSWRVTAGLRAAGRTARRLGTGTALTLARRARGGLRYVFRGDWQGLRARVANLHRETARAQAFTQLAREGTRTVGIMATPHTLYVAHLVARALRRANMDIQVFDIQPADFALDFYVVICPQMFKQLPPGEKRIAFQMEQSVSSRWFTPEYLQVLENSLAVLDYSQTNLAYLDDNGVAYPHTYHVPIGGMPGYPDWLRHQGEAVVTPSEHCDVLFYGDVNAPRRQALLQTLGERFNLRIEGNLFGPALRRAVAGAKVIINLHYYEGALLETTRIYECLSLGVPVVSEASADMAEHAEQLDGAVQFFPVGDAQAMLRVVAQALEQGPQRGSITQAVQASGEHFDFMLYRSLYALHLLDHATWESLTASKTLPTRQLALSLPETPRRRSAFLQVRPSGVQCFDGIRYNPGWVGCALSYRYLARKALQAGWPQLEVMEDDVEFPADYPERRRLVDTYLVDQQGQWDVFAGLIALVHPDTRVLHVERRGNTKFVTIDRMISMVHNIYAPAALQVLAQWNPHNQDPHTNTIDRHVQNSGHLRVVVALPFLVGHHEELHSSLWGVQNSQYTDLIAQAQAALEHKAVEFEKRS